VLQDLEDMRRQLELALQGSQRYEQLAESLQSALTASREALARAGTELEEKKAALRDANMELVATRNRFTIQEGDMERKMLQRDDTMADARQLCRGAWNCPRSAQFLLSVCLLTSICPSLCDFRAYSATRREPEGARLLQGRTARRETGARQEKCPVS
jgi:hypothetical protein